MGNATSNVNYMDLHSLWQSYDDLLIELARRQDVKAVAELGGGAKPMVADPERWGFAPRRTVIDISADELAKADAEVDTQVADLCQPISEGQNSYDLVFSKMLCEHLPNPRVFHENCYKLLRPGGLSVHFFPTLYTVPYVANKLMPEKFARSLLRKVQPGRIDDPKHEKFPAYYRWCVGPTRRSMRRYESLGFEVETWNASFGHDYYRIVPPLNAVERAKTRFLFDHPVPFLTSFATIVLRKPA